jgi:hypothetical protein
MGDGFAQPLSQLAGVLALLVEAGVAVEQADHEGRLFPHPAGLVLAVLVGRVVLEL